MSELLFFNRLKIKIPGHNEVLIFLRKINIAGI